VDIFTGAKGDSLTAILAAKIQCTGRSIAVRRDALWVLIKVCSEEALDMEEIFENVLSGYHI
jgi:hypothetical protein